MWCSSCRADVAAELSTDNRRMLCARCQMELGVAAIETPRVAVAPKTIEAERDARELLARWSAQNLEVPASTASSAGAKVTRPIPSSDPIDAQLESLISSKLPSRAPFADLGDPSYAARIKQDLDEATDPVAERVRTPSSSGRERSTQKSGPKVDLTLVDDESRQAHDRVVLEALQKQLNRGSSWTTLAGQLCAYGGVALLTCGTVLIMWSYFGGPPNYMPTGWLTAAVGQMLLFLGVVTLISSGMEQTVSEVTWRIDNLRDEIHRLSQSLEQREQLSRPIRRSRPTGSDGRSREDRRRDVA